MQRRDLLKSTGLYALGALAGLPALRAAEPAPVEAPTLAWDRSVVLIELRGGNDGLNTIVPYADPLYHRLRPTIGVREGDVLRLDRRHGFHPALKELQPAWQAGACAAVLGVGYPQPNRSHFRGIEIWNTAALAQETRRDGWLARLYAAAAASAPAGLLAHSLTLGAAGAQAHEGLGPFGGHREQNHFVIDQPERFLKDLAAIPELAPDPLVDRPANPALAHVRRLREEVTRIGRNFASVLAAPPPFTTAFPATQLGGQLGSVARFITSGALCPAYKCTLDGFDTHSQQRMSHDHLLQELAGALAAFRTALASVPGAWERTLVLTYSEFGRRAGENGSAGTDHGTAAPLLLLGGRIKAGFHGTHPSLAVLESEDLVHTTDFRSVYQGIARDFLRFDASFMDAPGITPLACCEPG